MSFETIRWAQGRVVMIDQTRLPLAEVYVEATTPAAVADAIRTMVIRGAPAIGIAAAMGVALAAVQSPARDFPALRAELAAAAQMLGATRPTAVNLFWALERMLRRADALGAAPLDAVRAALVTEAQAIHAEDVAACRAMGRFGAALLPDSATVLTHCNAGALATGGYGTALGVIRAAVEAGKRIRVFADETRPFLQGARLTAWELQKDGIDVTLITDNMAGHFLSRGAIDAVIVGTDRTVQNGDVANKIGTYGVAVLAHENGVPFYVAAPTSTLDLSLPDGAAIPIEERDPREVAEFGGVRVAPPGIAARHPAFDVTPARYVSAIITERGVARPPYRESLAALMAAPPARA